MSAKYDFWERPVLFFHLESFALRSFSAPLEHRPFPRDIKGRISHLGGIYPIRTYSTHKKNVFDVARRVE